MIKMNVFILLTLLEAFVAVAILAGFWFFRARKYKPYFEANTAPDQYIKRWLGTVIDYTRQRAMSLNGAAKKGDPEAIESRLNMVARLNWLSTERDFVELGKPNKEYWENLNRHINKLLKRWQSAKFIDAPPDAEAISTALAPRPGEAPAAEAETNSAEAEYESDGSDSELPYDAEDGPPPKDLRARVAYLEKQLRKFASYKTLFFGLQSTYEEVQKSYKKLKKSLSTMALQNEEAETLRTILADHEAHELSLTEKLKELENNKERMSAELGQLEALFFMQQQELDNARTNSQAVESASAPVAEAAAAPAPAASFMPTEDQNRVRELIDNQQTVLREIMGVIHTLPADADTKMGLADKAKEFERNNREIETCVTMLEMEMARLQQEMGINQTAQ